MKKSVKMENLLQSYMLDNGKAVPCGANLGYIDDKEWATWFPYVEHHNAGVPKSKDKNKDNLSVWNNGRGPFVDSQYHDGTFFDLKMKSKQPTFVDQKQEVWAGSPALEKREAYSEMTDEEVVNLFIQNQNEKQIVRSLKGLDPMPYLVMYAWQEINTDGTWSWKCVGVNETKYLKIKGPSHDAKSKQTCLIYRAKKPSKNSDYSESSSSARVEVKHADGLAFMQSHGCATEVCDPLNVDWKSIL